MTDAALRVLYYLEPWIELDYPLFRLGTVRNHLRHEIAALTAAGNEVMLVAGEAVAAKARQEGLLDAGLTVRTIAVEELRAIFPHYHEAARRIYDGALGAEEAARLDALVRSKTAGFAPDAVIAYENAGAFLRQTFPDAVVLTNSLGIFSREPYPETSTFDPFGIFKDSYVARYAEALRALPASAEAHAFVDTLRATYLNRTLRRHNPLSRKAVRGRFERVVLLPLQVSRYFAFDSNTGPDYESSSQFDFLCRVMERIDPRVGVLATEHGFERVVTERNAAYLRDRFPNLIFDEGLRRFRWLSQFALPHVDGVLTVSSSVGLQASFARKPLCVLGRSHLRTFADATDPAAFCAQLGEGREAGDRDGALFHLLTRYWPMMERYVHDPAWFTAFLRRSVERHRAGRVDFDFFAPIDEPDALLRNLVAGRREKLLLDGLRKAEAKAAKEAKAVKPAAAGKPARPAKAERPPAAAPVVSLASLHQAIDAADVVSFDIFDTLLVRGVAEPAHVWHLMEEGARARLAAAPEAHPIASFADARVKAARRAFDAAKVAGRREIDLKELYNELRKMHRIDRDVVVGVRKLEVETEARVLSARRSMVEAYRYARARGKRVVICSDMYLDRDSIEHLLRAKGFDGYERLYLSSAENALKKDGSLFDRMLADLGVEPRRILHIGDNGVSDLARAQEKGLKAIRIPRTYESFIAQPANAELWGRDAKALDVPTSLYLGLVANKLFDGTGVKWQEGSLFNGKPYNLGYYAGGIVMLQFAKWVLEEALADGVKTLYFLARDGLLVKEAYDQIAQHFPGAPRSVYLLASRRALSTPALASVEDAQASLDMAFSKVRLGDLLEARFELTAADVDPAALATAGFAGLDEVVTSKNPGDVARLRVLVGELAGPILANAAAEREAMQAYLAHHGLTERGARAAVVDIGHNGTLQRALSRMLGGRDLGGYYFATFAAAKAVHEDGLDARGYLLDLEDYKTSRHYYCRNIGMFEFLFLTEQKSFRKMTLAPGASGEARFVPVYVEEPETRRIEVAREVGRGIRDFVRDAARLLGPQVRAFDQEPETALKAFARYVQQPHLADAMIVHEVFFADTFGGSKARYLIATPSLGPETLAEPQGFLRDSWWRGGATAVLADLEARQPRTKAGKAARRTDDAGDRTVKTLAKPEMIGYSLWRKARKLVKSPSRFFRDAYSKRHVLA